MEDTYDIQNTDYEDESEEGSVTAEPCEGYCNLLGEDNGGVYGTGRLI